MLTLADWPQLAHILGVIAFQSVGVEHEVTAGPLHDFGPEPRGRLLLDAFLVEMAIGWMDEERPARVAAVQRIDGDVLNDGRVCAWNTQGEKTFHGGQ